YLAEHLGPSGSGPVASSAARRPPMPITGAYEAKCAACHGATMTGGSAPAILAYVRYHTNVDLTSVIRNGHGRSSAGRTSAIALTDNELRDVLNDLRALAGTDPVMATGGYTGQRGREPIMAVPSAGRGRGSRGEVTGVIVETNERST